MNELPSSNSANQTVTVNVIVGAQAAYACIRTTSTSLDVRLEAGHSPASSLAYESQDLRRKAQALIQRADLIEQASKMLAVGQVSMEKTELPPERQVVETNLGLSIRIGTCWFKWWGEFGQASRTAHSHQSVLWWRNSAGVVYPIR
jgi:hypothetical protein